MGGSQVRPATVRSLGIVFIVFAVAFNGPYAWLAANFAYPGILREPASSILTAFTAGGTSLILAWAAFALAGLLFAPVAVGMAKVTRRPGHAAGPIVALGVAAGVTQAIGLSRWVYAVPGMAAAWAAATDPAIRSVIETQFLTLHQFAGVGIGEAIGQSLTGFWMIGVAFGQWHHPRFGRAVATLGFAGGVILLLGIVEGISTVIPFDPGVFGLAALVGFLALSLWLIWTGVLCLARADAEG